MARVSLKPGDSVTVGLIDDQDVVVTDAKFTTLPPKNYPVSDRTFAVLKLKVLPDGPEADQYWSVGSNQQYVPDVNNPRVLNSSRTGIPDNCQFHLFLTKLVEAGFPESMITDDLGFIVGAKLHVERIEAPERKGLQTEGKTVLVPTKVISLPEAKGDKASAAASDEYSDELSEAVANALAEHIVQSGPIARAQAVTLAIRVAGSDSAKRSAAMKAANDDRFYAKWGFAVEGSIIRLAG